MSGDAPATNLRGMARAELEAMFLERGEARYRADQVFRRIHRLCARGCEDLRELPRDLRRALAEEGRLQGLELRHRARAPGGTEKFILGLGGEGAAEIEAVWIVGDGRRTVCVSCQSGCSLDCAFCATGTLPFRGNLETWQIVDQVRLLEHLRGERATNVVFMGMGEPFHNYESVLAAAHVLHDPAGSGLGARRITVSTAGVIAGVKRFAREHQPFNLAVSLNHPEPEGRSAVMSITRRQPLPELLAAVRSYTRASGRAVTFEYVMMAGVNLEPRHAEELIAIARSMRSKVNLIPLNTDVAGMRRPSSAEAAVFRELLVEGGVKVFDRGSPGRDVAGACGMLALDRSRGGATTADAAPAG